MASRTNRGRLPPRPAPVSARNNRSTSVVSDTGVNPLIDDLLGSVISSHNNSTFDPSSLIGQSISNRNSLVESDWGASPRSSSRMNKSSKMAIDTLSRISQHFVHTMRMFNMEDYFTAPNRDEAVRKMLREKTSVETEGLVISLLDLLEDVRNSRGQVAPLTGSLSALDGGRERLLSASMFSTMSTASMMRQPVQETTRVAMAIDKKGNRMINRYTIVANLGQGAFGKVKLGEEADSGNQVAIKIIDKKLLKKKIGGPDNDEALKREIAIMKKVRHKNCVSLYEVIDDPDSNKLYLIMDYVPNGPIVKLKQKQLLGNFLTSVENGKPIDELLYNKYLIRSIVRRSPTNADKPFSKAEIDSKPYIFWCTPVEEQLCAIYLRQLVSGLRYMHKRALVHHDIKPDNILLGNDHHVYLTDFGVSEMLGKRPGKAEEGEDKTAVKNEAPKLGGGTLVFTAPELFEDSQGENFNPYLTDVWALGVTVYCMLLGCLPFFGTSYPEISACVRNNPFPWNGQTLHSKTVLPQWKTILDGMLEKDPQKRWHLSQLKTFLDNKKFQEELRQTNPDFDGDRSMSSLLSDLAETQKAEAGMDDLRLIEEEMSKGDPLPLTLPKHRTISARARSAQIRHSISIRAREEELNKIEDEHLNDLKISASDIKQATTNMKVEIVEEAALVTPHTQKIVSKYVAHLRKVVEERQGGFYRSARSSDPSNTSENVETNTASPAPARSDEKSPILNDDNPFGGTNINGHYQKVMNYDTQQLDAMLSIVNLNSPGVSLSFSSSMQNTESSYNESRNLQASMSRSPNSLQQNSDRRLTVDSIADSSPTSTHNGAATDSNSRMRDKTLSNSKSCSQPSSASGSKVERRKTSKSMSSVRTPNSNSSPPSAAPVRVMTEPNFTHKAPAPTEPVNSSTNSSLPKDAPEVTARPALPDDSSSDESTESAPPKMLRTRVHHTVTSQEESLKSPTSPVDVLSPKMSSTKRPPEKEKPKESPQKTAKEAPKTDKKKKGEPSQRLLHASGKQSPPTPLVSEEQGSGNKKVKMRRKVSL